VKLIAILDFDIYISNLIYPSYSIYIKLLFYITFVDENEVIF